jgi:hypothetical protein
MKRDLFLDNPRCRWTQTPRMAQSPAEYASPLHRYDRQGYGKPWWACVLFCGAAALFFMVMT